MYILMIKDKNLIPKGFYCYTLISGKCIACPYWEHLKHMTEHESAYCHYLEMGAWNSEAFLLWDMVKECGINTGEEI